MSMYRQKDGLFWPSFFSVPSEKEKKQVLKRIAETSIAYKGEYLVRELLAASAMIAFDYDAADPCMQTACERVALKFILYDSDLAKDLLEGEEQSKARELYGRKQYNSKLLQKLLRDFLSLLTEFHAKNSLQNLFTISIMDELRNVQEDELNRTYGALKKTVERISSGVKSICYYEAERPISGLYIPLNEDLNRFFENQIKYNFNQAHAISADFEKSTLLLGREQKECNRLLQLALVNDVDFWKTHESFHIVSFLNEIVKHNDARHAEKIVAFLADNLRKMPHMVLVLEHNFPLYMSMYDELVESLEEQAFRFSFKRLEPYCDLSKIKAIQLCYPMNKADLKTLDIGKAVWEAFLSEYNYPADHEAVDRYLKDEVDRFACGETHKDNDIAVILDASFRYSADHEDRKLFSAYHPDCFSSENIWNRVYLKAYAVTLLSADKNAQFSYLQRIFVDLIKTIEKRMRICTIHQLDETTRTEHYEKLKGILKSHGIKVNDAKRNDYIVSLLDRDTALMEEAELFPVLEQIGDAIYGLAVAELLFYNPNTENLPESFEKFTRAEAQVWVSKKKGLDKLYLQVGLPAKYVEYDTLFFDRETIDDEALQAAHPEKYLADSLEMIIGSVCRDNGIEQALGFAKQILMDSFSKHFSAEVHPTDEYKHDRDIEMDYWIKILPAPCSAMTGELRTLWNALNKVALIASLGTETKEKRRFITNSFGDTAIYGEAHNHGVTWAFHEYLQNGLVSFLQKYGDTIYNNYLSNSIF